MTATPNLWLMLGAALSAIAAALHLAVIHFGAPWYRLFGAGERMAKLADAGSAYPTVVTSCIAAMLALWALYALSGAGVIRALPMMKPALVAITAIYLLRGFVIVPMAAFSWSRLTPFWWWSSAICLVYGGVHFMGLIQIWHRS